MKILKMGERPEDKIHHGTCYRCHTEIEFSRSEGTITSDQREGDYVSVNCPVCGFPISSPLHAGKGQFATK